MMYCLFYQSNFNDHSLGLQNASYIRSIVLKSIHYKIIYSKIIQFKGIQGNTREFEENHKW